MKKHYTFLALLLALSMIGASTQAQNSLMTANPNAERDIKLVSDYVNAMTVTGDQEKARGLISPTYMTHGPGGADSANTEKTMKGYQMNYKTQMNRKNDFSAQSFRIPSGDMKGDWVSLWGNFSYTDVRTGKAITFPYQYTAKVADGKIMSDRLYFDQYSVLAQIGFKFIPPGEAKK